MNAYASLSLDSDRYAEVLTSLAYLCYTNSMDVVNDLRQFFPESYQQLEKAVLNKDIERKLGVLLTPKT